MVEINTYNPAAVVNRTGGSRSGPAIQREADPKISAVSHARAAQGDGRLSFETQQAVARGAQAPQVVRPKEESAPVAEVSESAQQLSDTGTVESTGGGTVFAQTQVSVGDNGGGASPSVGSEIGGSLNIVV